MSKKQKLELSWIGEENRPKLEPRDIILCPLGDWLGLGGGS